MCVNVQGEITKNAGVEETEKKNINERGKKKRRRKLYHNVGLARSYQGDKECDSVF